MGHIYTNRLFVIYQKFKLDILYLTWQFEEGQKKRIYITLHHGDTDLKNKNVVGWGQDTEAFAAVLIRYYKFIFINSSEIIMSKENIPNHLNTDNIPTRTLLDIFNQNNMKSYKVRIGLEFRMYTHWPAF